jgi:hypothetical protein
MDAQSLEIITGLVERIEALEARRAEMIDGMDLRTVHDG